MGYIVEYAKSSKSSCRKCKGLIMQEDVRVGVLVPSPYFDGDMPLWHHLKCGFGSKTQKTLDDIKGFDKLRWDDQQKVKKAVGIDDGGGASSSSAKAVAVNIGSIEDYATVKYAGGGKCVTCSKTIAARLVRLIVTDTQEAFHIDEACWVIPKKVAITSLVGFDKLKQADKDLISQMISKANPDMIVEIAKPGLTKEEKEAKELNDKLWKIKDEVKNDYSNLELRALLKLNKQQYSASPSELLDQVADGMLFGALSRCPQCQGPLRPHAGGMVKCHGHLSSWSHCTYSAKNSDVPRNKWQKVSGAKLAELVDEIKDEKFAEKNAFAAGPPKAEDPNTDAFKELVFMLLGNWDGIDDDKQRIDAGGGSISANWSSKVTHVLAPFDEVNSNPKKPTPKRTNALKSNLPILDPAIIAYCARKKKTLKNLDNLDDFKVWVNGVAVKPDDAKTKSSPTDESANPKKRKRMVIPQIDKDCDERDNYNIFTQGGSVYAITLNMTDLSVGERGKNSLYIMQCLKPKTGKRFSMFKKWGRIGANEMIDLLEFNSSAAMIKEFEKKFFEMTGNYWQSYIDNDFEKKPGKYFPVDLEAEDEEDEAEANEISEALKARKKRAVDAASTNKKLDPRLAELIQLMFNKESINKQMATMNIDVKKMPLGQLSKKTLKSGLEILEKIEDLLKETPLPEIKLADLCNQFYTKIPHDFGKDKPPVIKTAELLQQKYDLLDTLMDIEVAARILEQESEEEDPLMVKYRELNNTIIPLDKSSDEWKRLETYVVNTCDHTKLKLLDIYKLSRNGEAESFAKHKKLEHRKLLFHGSKVAVFPAILSGGIKIMPHSGGRVGRGNYSADMIQKSQGYCGLAGNIGLILLNEVALGKPNDIYRDNSSLTKAPAGYDSVIARGTIHPDPSKDYIDKTLSPSGHPVIIPQGTKAKQNGSAGSSFMHNEYLVYNADQVHMRYLLMLQWPY